MRIIAGSAKGRRLRSLRGLVLRPTADRVREALFAMLGERVAGARFLDLYAGVGAVGLEALSRGAAEATFVESHRPAARLIRENLVLCGVAGRGRVLASVVARALPSLSRRGACFEFVFLDPPYDTGEAPRALAALAISSGVVAPGGLVICQHSRREELAAEIGPFTRKRQARFGETMLDFYLSSGSARLRPVPRAAEGDAGAGAGEVGRVRIALYAGTFDPVTYGHLDVVRRAALLFDKVIVGVSVNPRKESLFTTEQRVEMLREACASMSNVEVGVVPGLVVEFARGVGAGVIVRGLRAVSDFEFELQMASTNRALAPEVETIFFTPAPEWHYLSSSLVTDIARFGGSVSQFVPPHVERLLNQRLGGRSQPARGSPPAAGGAPRKEGPP